MILGFAGVKGSGKTNAARAYGDNNPVSFAAEIKRTATLWYGLSDEQVYGGLKEVIDPRWGLTPREIMQRLGTEVARSIHPDTWVNFLFTQIRPPIVIDDVRFDNEAKAIRQRRGKIILVLRPGLRANEYSGHVSESGVAPELIDHVITNDGSVNDLRAKVLALYPSIAGQPI